MNALEIYRIGDARVTKITELLLTGFTPRALFPKIDDEVLTNHPDWATSGSVDPGTGKLILSVHSWLVRSPDYTILIDTGIGNDKDRPTIPVMDHLHEPYLQRLAAAGVEPAAVDYVLITHLHADHVGWNTRWIDGQWIPAFPNARYVFSALEQRYCAGLAHADERVDQARTEAKLGIPVRTPTPGVYADSVEPVIQTGLAELVKIDGTDFINGISFHPAPGHSIDHAAILLQSRGERALFGGDVFHHPLEIYRPDLATVFCEFPDAALRSRKWLLEFATETGATYFSSHFPVTSAGRITRRDREYTWEFE
ncbi:MAG TPA: MBL fold metallo-hydrolase [Chthoniobacterales bacterium]|jgi:glyoxylase-like metal-dependent hydrolase (beta-lactamase superfamily II)|nr:MBL fold metallo-hydrolase [Chthoniobacterales bacterium]